MTIRRAWVVSPTLPSESGSGFALRVFSNVRALTDLGFEVRVIACDPYQPPGASPSSGLPGVFIVNHHVANDRVSPGGKLAYRLGSITEAALPMVYPMLQGARHVVMSWPIAWGEDLVVTEGSALSAALARAVGQPPIISFHDSSFAITQATTQVDSDLAGRGPSVPERRECRFLRHMDRWLLAHHPAVWTISASDRDSLRQLPRAGRVEYLPLSAPVEDPFRLGHPGPPGAALELLHLGATAHLPSYTSLRWLLQDIWPALPAVVRERIRLNVVGWYDPASPRTRRLLDLAAPYPGVRFHGFQHDLQQAYLDNHAQIVVSTMATGARTRVIESLAAGLPVITTPIATDGLEGLDTGGVISCADGPSVQGALTKLVADRAGLEAVAQEGRATYEHSFSRGAVRDRMRELLEAWGEPIPTA